MRPCCQGCPIHHPGPALFVAVPGKPVRPQRQRVTRLTDHRPPHQVVCHMRLECGISGYVGIEHEPDFLYKRFLYLVPIVYFVTEIHRGSSYSGLLAPMHREDRALKSQKVVLEKQRNHLKHFLTVRGGWLSSFCASIVAIRGRNKKSGVGAGDAWTAPSGPRLPICLVVRIAFSERMPERQRISPLCLMLLVCFREAACTHPPGTRACTSCAHSST